MLHVPWSVLQLDTIKTLIHEFGLTHLISRTSRKNDLVKLLQSIEREGHPEVLRRLTAERDSERRHDHVEHHQREREESPELEYSATGPAPSTSSASISAPVRPVVEIPVRVHAPLPSPRSTSTSTSSLAPRFPRTRAKGKARAQPSPSELEPELQSDSSSPPPPPPPIPSLSHVGPPKNKKRKAPPATSSARAGTSSRKRARPEPVPAPRLPPVDLSNVPLPSYSILYQQRQSISQPRRQPWPRLNPREAFAGVEIVPRNLEVGKRPSAGEEDVYADGEEDGRARSEGGASRPVVIGDTRYSVDRSERRGPALGARGTSTGAGTAASTTASVTRRMEAVVVASPKAGKAKGAGGRRKTIIVSDDETDFEV